MLGLYGTDFESIAVNRLTEGRIRLAFCYLLMERKNFMERSFEFGYKAERAGGGSIEILSVARRLLERLEYFFAKLKPTSGIKLFSSTYIYPC